jgi:hypothetical protein
MSEHKQLLEALLKELRNAINEPYASDQAKVIDIENVLRRFRFFLEKPAMFEAAKRIMDKAKGKEM